MAEIIHTDISAIEGGLSRLSVAGGALQIYLFSSIHQYQSAYPINCDSEKGRRARSRLDHIAIRQ